MPYVKPCEDQSHKEANILLEVPKWHEPIGASEQFNAYLRLRSDAMPSLYADMTTRMTTWWNASAIFQRSEPATANTKIIEPQKLVGRTTWEDILQISQQKALETADTETIEVYESVSSPMVSLWLSAFSTSHPGESTTANIIWEDFKKKIILSWQKRRISERFDVLTEREDNWDGYDSEKPTELTLNRARHLMEELFNCIISEGYPWLTPFISSDEDGNVTVEWSGEKRRLHIQIGEGEAEYIQVWGVNIDTEMHVGFLSRDDYLTLWEWLLDG